MSLYKVCLREVQVNYIDLVFVKELHLCHDCSVCVFCSFVSFLLLTHVSYSTVVS